MRKATMLRLRELRKNARPKVTLEDVAAAVGTDSGTMSRMERGLRFPNGAQLAALARFYGVEPHALFSTYREADPTAEEINQLVANASEDDLKRAVQMLKLLLKKEAP